jgi:hypothetical protein
VLSGWRTIDFTDMTETSVQAETRKVESTGARPYGSRNGSGVRKTAPARAPRTRLTSNAYSARYHA